MQNALTGEMYSKNKSLVKKTKNKSKMNIGKTRKVSIYFMRLLVIAIVLQLILLIYRLIQLSTM